MLAINCLQRRLLFAPRAFPVTNAFNNSDMTFGILRSFGGKAKPSAKGGDGGKGGEAAPAVVEEI